MLKAATYNWSVTGDPAIIITDLRHSGELITINHSRFGYLVLMCHRWESGERKNWRAIMIISQSSTKWKAIIDHQVSFNPHDIKATSSRWCWRSLFQLEPHSHRIASLPSTLNRLTKVGLVFCWKWPGQKLLKLCAADQWVWPELAKYL